MPPGHGQEHPIFPPFLGDVFRWITLGEFPAACELLGLRTVEGSSKDLLCRWCTSQAAPRRRLAVEFAAPGEARLVTRPQRASLGQGGLRLLALSEVEETFGQPGEAHFVLVARASARTADSRARSSCRQAILRALDEARVWGHR